MRIERFITLRKEYRDMLKYLVEDAQGNVIYVGPNYYFHKEGEYKSFSWKLAGASLLVFACCFVSGFFKFSGMNTRSMLLPYIPEVFGTAMALWAAGKGLFYNEPLRYHQYNGSYSTIPARFLLAAVSSLAGFISIIVYNIVYGGMKAQLLNTLLYLVLRLMVLAGSVLMILWLRRVEFIKKPGIDRNSLDLSEEDSMPEEMDDFEKQVHELEKRQPGFPRDRNRLRD
jgi:hypothetical protein